MLELCIHIRKSLLGSNDMERKGKRQFVILLHHQLQPLVVLKDQGHLVRVINL